MVLALAKDQSARLLKHVVRCYLRLSDNPRYVHTSQLLQLAKVPGGGGEVLNQYLGIGMLLRV